MASTLVRGKKKHPSTPPPHARPRCRLHSTDSAQRNSGPGTCNPSQTSPEPSHLTASWVLHLQSLQNVVIATPWPAFQDGSIVLPETRSHHSGCLRRSVLMLVDGVRLEGRHDGSVPEAVGLFRPRPSNPCEPPRRICQLGRWRHSNSRIYPSESQRMQRKSQCNGARFPDASTCCAVAFALDQ